MGDFFAGKPGEEIDPKAALFNEKMQRADTITTIKQCDRADEFLEKASSEGLMTVEQQNQFSAKIKSKRTEIERFALAAGEPATA